MNCQMADVTVTLRDGRTHTLENVFVRGSQIRFVILPDMLKNAPMFKVDDMLKNKPNNLFRTLVEHRRELTEWVWAELRRFKLRVSYKKRTFNKTALV